MPYQAFTYSAKTEYVFTQDAAAALKEQLLRIRPEKLFVLASPRAFAIVSPVLEELGQSYYLKSGCMPNPTASFVNGCAEELTANGCDFLLGVGGGSTIDALKATAILAANPTAGGVWDYISSASEPENPALPVGLVVTIPSTGSESNSSAVISNEALGEKTIYTNDNLYPVFSIASPALTYTLPAGQTAAGAADILSHLLETYLHGDTGVELSDNLLLGAMEAVVKYAPISLAQPDNYDARANLLWASYLAMNRVFAVGHSENWISHMVEHTISAKFDMTHGAGMAIVLPAYIKTLPGAAIAARLEQLSEKVFGAPGVPAHEALKRFFSDLNLPATLAEAGIHPTENDLMECAQKSVPWGPCTVEGLGDFTEESALALLRSIC